MAVPTVGVEEEFLLVDAGSGALRPDAADVLAAAESLVAGGLDAELQTAVVETGSAVCADLAGTAAELHRRRAALVSAAGAVGARVLATGTHPTASPTDVPITDKERYQRMAAVFGPLAGEALVCGCHVHVAVPDREEGVAVLDRIRPWLAVLLAAATNSPLWDGRDTGYASWRAQVWKRWPTAGPTSAFGSLAAYDRLRYDLIASGAALDDGMLYFDARLSARYPTVEIRVADVCPAVEDAVLVAALARGLVVTALAAADRPAPEIPVELLRAAAWAASRYGLGGRLVDPVARRARPAGEVVDRLHRHLRAALEETGDAALVSDGLARLGRSGTGADRQRAAFGRGGPAAVLAAVALEG